MTIIRWHQRPAMAHMLDRFFNDEFNTGFERNRGCAPATNILEKGDHYEIQLAAPGLAKEDFKLNVEDGALSISYEPKTEEENQDKNRAEEIYLRHEFAAEAFTRAFTLPKNVDAEHIKARYENGVLYVSVPREDPEKARLSKRIEIA